MRRGACAYLAVVAALGVPAGASAATIKVTTTADQNGTGPGKCALREAIQAANNDVAFGGCRRGAGVDRIDLRAGKRYALGSAGSLSPLGDMTIVARGKGRATINARDANESVFFAAGTGNTLKKLVITGGDSAIGGGGIILGGAGQMTILNSVVKRNETTGEGGGILNNGDMRIVRSTIARNKSVGQFGGGISDHAGSGGSLIIDRSTIEANQARGVTGSGGGVYAAAQDLDMVNSTVARNRADGDGGGVYVVSGSVSIQNSTLRENVADANDSLGGSGGAIARAAGSAGAVNSILAGNSDVGDGSAPDCAGDLSLGYTLLGDSSGCTGFFPTPDNVLDEAAKLKPLANYGGPTRTYALKAASPARNAGNPATPLDGAGARCHGIDQRGEKRPKGGRCDMGAFERK